MLQSFIALCLVSIGLLPAFGGAWLMWDANQEPDLAGYHVHYGVVGQSGTNVVGITTNRWSLDHLERGQYYWFYVTASNQAGLSSDPSEIILTSLPAPVSGTSVTNQPPDAASE